MVLATPPFWFATARTSGTPAVYRHAGSPTRVPGRCTDRVSTTHRRYTWSDRTASSAVGPPCRCPGRTPAVSRPYPRLCPVRAPGRSRTCNLMGRNHLLYPVELRRPDQDDTGRSTYRAAPRPSVRVVCHTGGSLVAVAQLVERRDVAPEVAGSSPVGHPQQYDEWRGPRCLGQPTSQRFQAPLAQRQSNGLLIHRFWVRIPGGAPGRHGVDAAGSRGFPCGCTTTRAEDLPDRSP